MWYSSRLALAWFGEELGVVTDWNGATEGEPGTGPQLHGKAASAGTICGNLPVSGR